MRILILAPEPPGRGILLSLAALGVAPVVALARGESATDGPLRYERVMARGDVTDPINLRWSRRALRIAWRNCRSASAVTAQEFSTTAFCKPAARAWLRMTSDS